QEIYPLGLVDERGWVGILIRRLQARFDGAPRIPFLRQRSMDDVCARPGLHGRRRDRMARVGDTLDRELDRNPRRVAGHHARRSTARSFSRFYGYLESERAL